MVLLASSDRMELGSIFISILVFRTDIDSDSAQENLCTLLQVSLTNQRKAMILEQTNIQYTKIYISSLLNKIYSTYYKVITVRDKWEKESIWVVLDY